MVTAERKTVLLKNEFQQRLVSRAHDITNRLKPSGIRNEDTDDSIGQEIKMVEEYLFRSGLKIEQIEEVFGLPLHLTNSEEQSKIYESRKSGVIFDAETQIKITQDLIKSKNQIK